MIRQEIVNLISRAAGQPKEKIQLERPEQEAYGDYSTNIALRLKKDPVEIAGKIKSGIFEKVETAKPGFINFFISKEYLQKQVKEVLKQKGKYGSLKIGKGEKVNIEFISANPTGPLHVGNARGGFCGDVLANVLRKAGYKPSKEYYVNNMGRQVGILKDSLEGKDGYKNEYVDKLRDKGEKNVGKAINYIMGRIKETTGLMGVKFDKWFYENSLYPKQADKVKKILGKKGLSYEKDNAVWFESTKSGYDDKDRVLIRANDKETYLLSDLAYLDNKFKRGFVRLIIFLGAEHHGYVGRLRAGAQALNYDPKMVEPIVMQLVKLLEKGKEVRMSKREGVFVSIDDLLKEIKPDVARFFFLTRNYGSHLLFDLDLAKEQSEKNPVYYVQYAHARIASLLRKSKLTKAKPRRDLLKHDSELGLIKQLIRFPEIVEDTAKDYQVQRIPQYALDLATSFHRFYRDCQVISEDKELTQARLALVLAAKIVFKNTLDLMGISAPENM